MDDFKIKAYVPISVTCDLMLNAFCSFLGLNLFLLVPDNYKVEKNIYKKSEIKEFLKSETAIVVPSVLDNPYLYNLKVFKDKYMNLTVFLDDFMDNNHCLKIKRDSFGKNETFFELSLKQSDLHSFYILNSFVNLFSGSIYIGDNIIKKIEIQEALYKNIPDLEIQALKNDSKINNFKSIIDYKSKINLLRFELDIATNLNNDLLLSSHIEALDNKRMCLINNNIKRANNIYSINIGELIDLKKENCVKFKNKFDSIICKIG